MRIGQLRHRIVIQSQTEVSNSYGEPVTSWQDDATVWGQIAPTKGRELDAAQQTIGETSFDITMRYRVLDHSQRLMHEQTVYDIREILPPNDRSMLTVRCTVGTTDG